MAVCIAFMAVKKAKPKTTNTNDDKAAPIQKAVYTQNDASIKETEQTQETEPTQGTVPAQEPDKESGEGESNGTYMLLGMLFGLCAGLLASKFISGLSQSMGMCFGMPFGLMLGSLIKKK